MRSQGFRVWGARFPRIHLPRTRVNKGKRGESLGCYGLAEAYSAAATSKLILGSIASQGKGGTTMVHSDELRDLTLLFYEAAATGDLSFFDRHVSRLEGVVFIGTDPNEWWEGLEALREAMRAQSEAMEGGGLQIVSGQLEAYREGNVGWVIDRDALFRLPDGTEIPFRNTLVFLREEGEWKLVHGHSSIGVRNEELFGEDVTASS